ncbi:hypothetical protein SUGI_0462090 [Cryptomeria japonica]|uniref:CASP-like protein 4B4 n=1 Tax=Cryptomeria japonica TaxID=3369 RepID=UPI002408D805|nr:CASP-like protein 4B4 [Cryptomeria japonica]GLJ24232.1 hypothetical protein SUGI_0462090 [Cryptomeria japonica]
MEFSNNAGNGGNPAQAEPQTNLTVLWRQRERRQLLSFMLRCAALLFSFLSFVIMASNNQGKPGLRFSDYEEYRYSLGISVIAFLYLAVQVGKGIYDIFFGNNLFSNIVFLYIDFIGDQLLAYLLMSSSSSAASLTNGLRDGGDTRFTDMAAASVSMSFFTFGVLAASAILSGITLSQQIRWS